MKKILFCFAAVLTLVLVCACVVYSHAASAGAADAQSGVSEVSTDFEVTITLPTAAPVLRLNMQSASVKYLDTVQLSPVSPVRDVSWRSDNTRVAAVDANGLVRAAHRGTAEITAETADGQTAKCTVTVYYTPRQWIIMLFLFGWLWYR